ncbi:MFS transporter [Paenibacillus mucilaginosus]|uniref:Major facilitator superfamily protein n=2 Tax=Paenibacillus mucilaginosus TaxID=61624 RepID=H6NKG2_9BACL|nr:MFS transporter [Paenibacillus mucilaginosus]AEI44554.1 major facilitator superfamily MFS_1 [Paenibacillus mucilaginosus KNP414]AFC32353.1 major facilitator superfamily protein [Paenibacillus mucilaginosus 3016]MCG7218112.1 MFS transporter [Paenibacillus mucilaginosus]WDM26133.1 MFS transporter [Paenibacillus mucilaginosus]WFA20847.1 MFS transporter [Paenibacillus mucilaginosus]
MAGWQRNMWILWACVLLCSASYTMCVPFLPLFLFELGVSGTGVHLWAGLVLSASFLVGVVMGPFWGMLSDRYGKRNMIIRAGLSLAAVYLLFTVVRSPWELLGVRLLHGFVAGFIPASMALVASTAPKEKLGEALGYMQSAAMSGGILGPLLGGVLASAFGMRQSFAAAAVIVLLAALSVILFVREAPLSADGGPAADTEQDEEEGGASTLGEWLRSPMLVGLLGLLFLYQLAVNTIQPILSLHLAELQGQLEDAALTSGIVLALAGAAGILASPWWGRRGASWGGRRILPLCLAGAGSLLALQSAVPSVGMFSAVQFAYGLFIAGIVPTVNTMIMRHTHTAARGRSFGLTSSANQLGGLIGPLAGGALGVWLGSSWVFAVTGAVLMASAAAVLGLQAWRSRTAPRTSPAPAVGREGADPAP